jgi:hypothetical protein
MINWLVSQKRHIIKVEVNLSLSMVLTNQTIGSDGKFVIDRNDY